MTKNTDWQRARRPEQKEQRRAKILEAAATLLETEGLEGAGLNAIARQAGISKANIYRYFESREAVLLHLLLKEEEAWAKAVKRRLARLAGSGDHAAIARAFVDPLAKRPVLCQLLSTLAGVLEHNLGEETILDFKGRLLEILRSLTPPLSAAAPDLTDSQARDFLNLVGIATSGAWPFCNPAPAVAKVLAREEFADLRLAFKPTMQLHAETLLRGLTTG